MSDIHKALEQAKSDLDQGFSTAIWRDVGVYSAKELFNVLRKEFDDGYVVCSLPQNFRQNREDSSTQIVDVDQVFTAGANARLSAQYPNFKTNGLYTVFVADKKYIPEVSN